VTNVISTNAVYI